MAAPALVFAFWGIGQGPAPTFEKTRGPKKRPPRLLAHILSEQPHELLAQAFPETMPLQLYIPPEKSWLHRQCRFCLLMGVGEFKAFFWRGRIGTHAHGYSDQQPAQAIREFLVLGFECPDRQGGGLGGLVVVLIGTLKRV